MENGKEKLERSIYSLNCYRKVDKKQLQGRVILLDVTVMKKGNGLITDLYVKLKDTREHIDDSCITSLSFIQYSLFIGFIQPISFYLDLVSSKDLSCAIINHLIPYALLFSPLLLSLLLTLTLPRLGVKTVFPLVYFAL